MASGSFVKLPRREAAIFEKLLDRRGRFVSRDVLYEAVYRLDDDVDQAVIESHISKLRAKVSRLGIDILSERFKGYQLISQASGASHDQH